MGVHRHVRELLGTRDLRFGQVRELLRIDAGLIAHAAVLLGDINRHEAAEEYARTALRLTREVHADQGFSWYARAKTARWRGRYVEAADLARRGYEATATSPMRLQLAWYEASAAALLGDTARAREAVRRVREPADLSTTAGADRSVWSFPAQRRTLFAVAVAVRTGDPDEALRTVAQAERTSAAEERPSPANWAQIKVATGLAHILKDDVSGVIHEVTPVLTLPPEMRLGTVTGYLDDMSRALGSPRHGRSPDVVRLRRRIREFNAAALADEHAVGDA